MEQETISKNGVSSKNQMSRGNKKQVLGIVIACVAILFCSSFTFKSSENTGNNMDQIIGVWKSVSGTNGERVKIITQGHFIWTQTINNRIVASAGGSYTFDGETYTENIEFGTENMSKFFGKKAVVKIQFEGKKMNYIGLLADTISLNEVWERIE